MTFKTPMKIIPALVTALLALGARAGTLDPALEAAVAEMDPGDVVDVIIRCVEPLDPESVPPEDLVPSLKNKAAACERSLTNVLENTALEPPVTLWIINGIAAKVPVASLHGLANRAGVEMVYLNETVELPPEPVLAGAPGNPPFTYWNLSETRVTDLWALGYYGTGVVVATMDTGVDALHADIGPQWRGGSNSWYDPNGEHATPYDANGHGTQVMGVIVGGNAGGFDMGMAPDAQWIAAKIFDDADQSDLAKIHQGFQWLLDPNQNGDSGDAPDIVNNSWVLQGTEGECLGEFADDIEVFRSAGIAMVFSAGNSGWRSNTSMEPANDPASLSVGAIDSAGRVIRSSSRGPSACDGGIYPKIAAPGKDVLTAGLTTGGANPTNYSFGTGTSFAAPHVAGALAVLKSAFAGETIADIEAAIGDGALDLGAAGADNDSGAGLIDVVEAYMLLSGSPPPPPPPPSDADGDGVPDSSDQCPSTPPGESVDANGCSASQRDSDGDGVRDDVDQCLSTPASESADANGCSASQRDSDGDGVSDALDLCPDTQPGETVDADGCTVTPGPVNSIQATATYNSKRSTLDVIATSALGADAQLQVVDYGAMKWDRKKNRWTLSARNVASNPGTVTVKGVEGEAIVDVQ